jgi:hypothetical protein
VPTQIVYTLGDRARAVAKQLHEATDELNGSLARVEIMFSERLDPTAHASVLLIKSTRHRGDVYFSFRNSKLFIEIDYGSKLTKIPLLHSPREMRIKAASKLKELWVACGGQL